MALPGILAGTDMGGGGNKQNALEVAGRLNMQMENEMYGLSKPALQAGTDYLTGAYGQGGFDQSAKYGAMQTQALDTPLGGNIMQGNLGQASGNRASALSGIGGQKLAAGVDEMNKLRSMLAQKGLRTTNLAQEAGAQSIAAIPQMAQGNQTLSTILGVGAVGASAYGGYKQDQVAQQMKAQNFFNNPYLGSDTARLQWPGGGATSAPGWK